MKRAKLKIEILTVIFCSLIFAFSEKNNSIYADEVLTDMELPTGRLVFEEETEEAADEDYESMEAITFMISYRTKKKRTGMP